MKKAILLFICCVSIIAGFAQKETFDLVTYTTPKGWKKQVAEGALQFTKEDAAKGSYCSISLFKSVPGTDNSKENFDKVWASLVKEMVTVTSEPEMQAPATENGWEIQSGYASFENDGNKGAVILVTSSGFGKMMNVIILTNTNEYEKNVADFLESINLKKPETTQQQTNPNENNNAAVIGTWGISTTIASYYNTSTSEGSIVKQYTFNKNGTYSFYIKTFQYMLDKLLLTRETGTYQISGNSITISPQKSAVESWTKKNNTAEWGKLISSQKRELEKATYQFVAQDFGSGPVLVLKAAKPTKRDGPFNNGDKDAWFYPSKSAIEYIKLPGGEQQTVQQTKEVPATTSTATSGFKFTTSNFDDGWTSTEQKDWVEVRKGNATVLIHWPIALNDEIRTDPATNCWNIFASGRYNVQQIYNFRYSVLNDFPYYFLQADATEKSTGKTVFVSFQAVPRNGVASCYEIITPSKAEFVQHFPTMDKVENMGSYNKFAIAASDLKGKWTSSFSGMQQYVNVYTGADAGMSTNSSYEVFEFSGDSYKWELKVVSGFVGNAKFQGVKSTGKLTVLNNWQVHFSKIEDRARTYNAYFACIRGARLLCLQDKDTGGFSNFGKVE